MSHDKFIHHARACALTANDSGAGSYDVLEDEYGIYVHNADEGFQRRCETVAEGEELARELADKYDAKHMTSTHPDYWYLNRDKLEPEMVFQTYDGGMVKLDHGKPGDGTLWVVATWHKGFPAGPSYPACAPHWSHEEDTIEPGDLRGEPIKDPAI